MNLVELNNKKLVKAITNDFSDPLWKKNIKNNYDFGYTYDAEAGYEFIDNRKMDSSYLLNNNRLNNLEYNEEKNDFLIKLRELVSSVSIVLTSKKLSL